MTTLQTPEEIAHDLRAIREEVRAIRLLLEARLEGTVASADDILHKYGDPLVRFRPKTWPLDRADEKGRPMSRCSPEFLDHLARALDQMATKDAAEGKLYKGRPSAPHTRRQAGLARRWAIRKRLGWEPPPEPVNEQGGRAPERRSLTERFAGPSRLPVDHEHGDAYEGPDDSDEMRSPDDEEHPL